MDAPTPPAAPAPPLTASEAAVVADDFQSFHKAEQAARVGKPLPVPVPTVSDDEGDDEPEPAAAVAPAGSTPSAPVSKKQQRINDAIRTAVEAATREDKAELARLRAAQPPHEPRVAPAAVASPSPALAADPHDPEPDHTDATKYPGGEYDPKFLRAAAAWDNRQERRQSEAAAQARAAADQQDQAFRSNAKAASDAWEAKAKADPEFRTRLNPDLMKALIPASQIPVDDKGQRLFALGPLNVIAQEMLDHPDTAPDLADFLSTHPEDLTRLTALDPRTGVPMLSSRQLIREIGRIEGRLSRAEAPEPPPAPNVVTDAPLPPTTLGTRSTTPADPIAAAVKRNDFATFNRLELEKKAAGQLRR